MSVNDPLRGEAVVASPVSHMEPLEPRLLFNAAPYANDDVATVALGQSVLIDPRLNDTDGDGDGLTVVAIPIPPGSGTAVIENGLIRYTPTLGITGVDPFVYRIMDGGGAVDTATVHITITAAPPANQPPVAVNDSATIQQGQSILVNVLSNDTDPNSDPLTLAAITTPPPANTGIVAIENNQLRFTPAAAFSGSVNIGYQVSDGRGGTATATATITVTPTPPVNQPPVANNDTATTPRNTSVLINVVSNDTDPDGNPLTVSAIVTAPSAGTGTAGIEGNSIRFTPANNYTGPASFTYRISDGQGGTATATVNITVTAPANQPPVANNDTASTPQNTSVLINVVGNDTDPDGNPLTVSAIVTAPAAGTGTAAIEGNSIRFTPANNYTGPASFTYRISDGQGGTATASVSVTVTPVTGPNVTPYANDDTATVALGQSVLIDPTLNDTDANGDPLAVVAIVTPPGSGTAVIENGKVRYTPTLGITGVDPFVYRISDGRGGGDTATVHVTITPAAPNQPPVAGNDTTTTQQGQSVLINVLGNDSDPNGDPLTITGIPTPPATGTAAIESNQIRYTPASGFSGSTTFTYTISDGKGGTATATATITVTPLPQAGALSFASATYTVNEHDGSISIVITRVGGSSGTVTVDYATVNGTATAAGTNPDFTATSGTLTFGPGVTQQTLTVPIINDPSLEGDQAFTLTLSNPTGGATLGAQAGTTVTIKDNDGVPGGKRVVVIGSSSVAGDIDRNSFRRPLSASLQLAGYGVNFVGSRNTNGSTATPPNPDFDRDHEGYGGWTADEMVTGRSGIPSLASRLAGASADGDVLTPDIALIYIGHNDIFQGQSPQNVADDLAQIIATLRADNPSVTILLGKLAPSAWDGGIHNVNLSAVNVLIDGLVTSLDTAASRVAAVDLATGFDTSVYTTDGQHPNAAGEAFMADRWFDKMKQVLDGTLPPPPTPTNPGTLALESSTYTVNEQAGTVTVAVVRTGGSDGSVSIDYSTVEGGATAGSDYQYTEGTVTLGPGVTRATFTVPIINDTLAEGNEIFGVSLNRVTGGADLAQPRTATITIVDNDSPPPTGTGDGLKGDYYDNIDFTGTKVTRTDSTVNFNWGSGTPITGIAADTFSVRWTGQIEARFSEIYTFTTTSDDGVRLWINGQLIIDQWTDHSSTNHSGSIGLIAGQRVDIRMDFYENGGSAVAQLRWASTSQAQQVVPTAQLYSTGYTGQIDTPALLNPVTVYSGLTQPTALSFTSNGLAFIAQKNGIVRVAENGSLVTTPFLDIRGEVNDVRDRGMLGMAAHPNFPATPYVYLLYTYDPPETVGRTGYGGPDGAGARGARLIRVTADAANGYRTAVPGSAVVLLGTNSTWQYFGAPTSQQSISNPYGGLNPDGTYVRDSIPVDSESHTIGGLAFMSDGSLLVTSGDGTSYGAVDPKTARVQDVNSLNGKVLRIDAITGQGLSSNPFYDGDPDSNRSKVYALGFRNPFRIVVDQATGRVYVGDVGWSSWEEIDAIVPGGNYGWPWYEGGSGALVQTPGYRDLAAATAFYNSGTAVIAPIWGRSHTSGGVAIVAGDFNTGSVYASALSGALFISDYGVPAVDAIKFNTDGSIQSVTRVASSVGVVVEMTMGPDGHIYFVDITGRIAKLALP